MSKQNKTSSKLTAEQKAELAAKATKQSNAAKIARTKANKEKHLAKARAMEEKKKAEKQAKQLAVVEKELAAEREKNRILEEAAARGVKIVALPDAKSLALLAKYQLKMAKLQSKAIH